MNFKIFIPKTFVETYGVLRGSCAAKCLSLSKMIVRLSKFIHITLFLDSVTIVAELNTPGMGVKLSKEIVKCRDVYYVSDERAVNG